MLVVDASALAALAFGEAEAPAVSSQLAEEALHAPSLLDLELANAACSRSRRHDSSRCEPRWQYSRARRALEHHRRRPERRRRDLALAGTGAVDDASRVLKKGSNSRVLN